MGKKVFFTAVFLVTMLFAVVGWATTYTVCSSGCDYTTLRAVFDNEDLEPGDIIEVRANTVGGSRTETIKVLLGTDDSGAEGNPIIVRARSGDTITIDVNGSYDNCINTNNQSHIVFDGFRLTGSTNSIIRLTGSSDITIQNCTIYNANLSSGYALMQANNADDLTVQNCSFVNNTTYYGIRWSGNNSIIKGNTFSGGEYTSGCIIVQEISNTNISDRAIISNNLFQNITSGTTGDSHCIGLAGGTTASRPIKHVDILDNIMINAGSEGVEKPRISVYNSEDVNILRNQIINCKTPGILVGTNSASVTVAYNLISGGDWNSSDTRSCGVISVEQSTGGCAECTQINNVAVVNNTIINCDDSGVTTYSRSGFLLVCANEAGFEVSNISFKNNVVYNTFVSAGDKGFELRKFVGANASESGIVFDHNCYYRSSNTSYFISYQGTIYSLNQFSTYQNTESQDANSIASNPLLTPNYHLSRNSPCIDAGTKLSIHDSNWRDLAGNRQRYGTNPDIGCYERNTDFSAKWGGQHGWTSAPWGVGKWKKNRWTPYE